MSRPTILVANDDGYQAKGFDALIRALSPLGDIIAIAPERAQSSTSHAITMREPVRITLQSQREGCTVYSCSGMPADCVKFAMHELMTQYPDLIATGINHGENASCSALYSGTVAAAMEGCMYHVPSIAFSLLNHLPDAEFETYLPFVRSLAGQTLEKGLPDGTCLNVNIPDLPYESIQGVRICRAAKGRWKEVFDRRTDPYGRVYYWLTGYFINEEPEATDTDQWALEHQYISIVLEETGTDLTHFKALDSLQNDYFIF